MMYRKAAIWRLRVPGIYSSHSISAVPLSTLSSDHKIETLRISSTVNRRNLTKITNFTFFVK